ncbi:ribosome biogenesis GTP-binding protein YihA/YsxC [Caldithrix abyssi]|uniref:Probable GTP-binding protein EngB n=1 Tax=Caldithrix abyssi DSM 13497 TaxID=880073 RepID=H1XWV1_CALAY|nr:ribosome biogenesis GTP-binding protein YihA/YsxC [Caldithrix abyssi]APF19154.1 engB GTP-binding protein [Caldithrix abyssi DSM 13497]EHO43077.1 GTP-binding protein engB [Caldithrix abyssi DSM 13497]
MAAPIFKQAEFYITVKSAEKILKPVYPEVAFLGRSNVGKSSLINAVLGKKNLALTSSSPGKTRGINYFLVDKKYFFVDLPGYGFAKISKSERLKWQKLIESYLLQSKLLKILCLLIDSRRDIMESDAQMVDWLQYQEKPFFIVLTKTDKLSKNQLRQVIKKYQDFFPDNHILPFSIKDKKLIADTALFIKKALN